MSEKKNNKIIITVLYTVVTAKGRIVPRAFSRRLSAARSGPSKKHSGRNIYDADVLIAIISRSRIIGHTRSIHARH